MDSVAFHFSTGSISHACPSLEKPGLSGWPNVAQAHTVGKLTSSARKKGLIVSCAKAPETIVSSKSDVLLDKKPNGSLEKHAFPTTFPNAFEALFLEICDETSVAEVQLKVGEFEMHLKRNVGAINAPMLVAPPIPTEPLQSTPSTPSTPSTSNPKPSPEKANPVAIATLATSSKLAALEASGADGFKLVPSPSVGSFRRGRTIKGKKQPPNCKQGDFIKEGQVIGYIDQFGTQLPVKSDVAGEVLKLLFDEGDAVGYGDPLIAVLPSFHGLN